MSTRDLDGKSQVAAEGHTGQAPSDSVRMYQAPVPPPTFSKAQSTVAGIQLQPKHQATKAAAAAQIVSLTCKQVRCSTICCSFSALLDVKNAVTFRF